MFSHDGLVLGSVLLRRSRACDPDRGALVAGDAHADAGSMTHA
jgi:hypothetical protein